MVTDARPLYITRLLSHTTLTSPKSGVTRSLATRSRTTRSVPLLPSTHTPHSTKNPFRIWHLFLVNMVVSNNLVSQPFPPPPTLPTPDHLDTSMSKRCSTDESTRHTPSRSTIPLIKPTRLCSLDLVIMVKEGVLGQMAIIRVSTTKVLPHKVEANGRLPCLVTLLMDTNYIIRLQRMIISTKRAILKPDLIIPPSHPQYTSVTRFTNDTRAILTTRHIFHTYTHRRPKDTTTITLRLIQSSPASNHVFKSPCQNQTK
jgi:hypothetical protein